MPRIAYESHKFTAASRGIIDTANEILNELSARGYVLTIRQLYYQFVARGLIPLDPAVIDELIVKAIKPLIDRTCWQADERRERVGRRLISEHASAIADAGAEEDDDG